MATALASAITGRLVRRDVAMTGEITLSGRVLPIGGVKEKVLGAHRAGIRHIVLPKQNEADIDDVPTEVQRELEFHLAETLSDVLAVALAPTTGDGAVRSEPAAGTESAGGESANPPSLWASTTAG
jgi:ATP-dependent Lon protease